MKKLLPILSGVLFLTAACNTSPKAPDAATVQAADMQQNAMAADTAGLAQFRDWKAQNELAVIDENIAPATQQATAPARKAVAKKTAPVRKATTKAPVRKSTSTTQEASGGSLPKAESDGAGTGSGDVAGTGSGEQAAEPAKKEGISKAVKGAVIGGVGGAAAGAVINKKNRTVGAVVGGVIGAAGGYVIGRKMDQKDGQK
ncbi:MAG TPA: YMGG-like glycine zipper-containing protein [Flavisolibacter sp.]